MVLEGTLSNRILFLYFNHVNLKVTRLTPLVLGQSKSGNVLQSGSSGEKPGRLQFTSHAVSSNAKAANLV